MCGIIGIIADEDVVDGLYSGLLALQHRGQDAAGIITYDHMFHLKKGIGLVLRVFTKKNLERLKGNIGIGHTRYPTIGPGGTEDAQPFYVNTPFGIAMAHNGNVTNYWELKRSLAEESFRHLNSHCDVEVILNVFADELSHQNIKEFDESAVFEATRGVFERVRGSYSVVGMIVGKGLLGFRDPYGIRPLIFGRRGNSYGFASESVAFDLLGYETLRDVKPGEVIFVDMDRRVHSKVLIQKRHTPCIFEWVYFARPDSVIDGIGVYEARLRLGRELAKECLKRGIKPDVVVPVPDTARAAALPIAQTLGVELREGLIKNRYIARTFIMPTQRERIASVRQKLNPIKSEISGKRVLLVDDSIVRGTTSREIISLVRKAGAKEVYFAVTCPPLRYPCVYGIDMATRGEFIAKTHSVKEIERLIGADVLVYQTLEGMIKAVKGERPQEFCTACFTNRYPTGETEKTLRRFELERIQVKEG